MFTGVLVHAAFADGIVNEDEFQLLERLLPDLSAGEVLVWVANRASAARHRQGPRDILVQGNEAASRTRTEIAIDREVDPQEHQFLKQPPPLAKATDVTLQPTLRR